MPEKVVNIYSQVALIAEDDPMVRQMLAGVIRKEFPGVSVVQAENGEEAMRHIRQSPPSVLILNMMMPAKTGAEVLQELSPTKRRFPILVISGFVESEEQVSELGKIAKDRFKFLKKPFRMKEFTRILREMLVDGPGSKQPSD